MKKPNKSSSWIEQIHLEKYEILFNAYSRFTLVSGLRVMVKYHDIFRGQLCSPALKQNSAHLKMNFQSSRSWKVTKSVDTRKGGYGTGTSIFQPIHSLMQIQVHCDLLNMLGHHTSPITLMMDPGQALKDVRIRAVYHKAVTGFCITI